jgi:hypothetical protein
LSGYLQAIGEIVDEFSPDVVHVNDYVYMPAEIIEIFSQRGCVVVRNVCNCEELCHQDYPVVSSGLKGRLCAGPGNPAKCSQCFLSEGESLREEDAKASLETLTTRRVQYIRHLYRNAVDRVIFTTGAFKEYFTRFVPIPPEKIRVIPRGFQFDFPRPEKRRETADGTVHFAFIGNIMFSKASMLC